MNILITGSSGFVGSRLIEQWMAHGHQITAVDAILSPHPNLGEAFRFVQADTTRPGDWQDLIQDADATVNLTGKNIFTRWTARSKQQIHDSRILTTRNIVAAPSPMGRP